MKRISIVFLFCMFQVLASRIYAGQRLPYSITGSLVNENSDAYENYGFSGVFKNHSEKAIESFTVVFFVFDDDGNCPLVGRNNVVVKIEKEILPQEKYEFVLNMDSFLPEASELDCEADYVYVSRIEYSDKTEWSDPFGMEIF